MTDDKGRFIRISKKEQDWQLINKTPTPLFVRYNQTAQVEPDRNYEPDIFDRSLQLTNVKDEQSKVLLKVYIVSPFIPEYKREKIHALSLDKECYSMKMDLLTNATVVDDAIRFVSSNQSKMTSASSNNEGNKEESKEPDYDEDEDQLEENQESADIAATTNEVF